MAQADDHYVIVGPGFQEIPLSQLLVTISGVQAPLATQLSAPTLSTASSITAHAGGGQGSATKLTATINRVTVVATAGDSVVLPASRAGAQMTVINAGASSLNIFPSSGDAINGGSVNAAVALAAGKTDIISSAVAGQWHAVLSA